MKKSITDKIGDKLSIPDIVDALSERITMSELQSLLLDVYKKRAENLKEKDLFAHYKKSKYVSPSIISYKDYLKLDNLIVNCLPEDFQVLELSPVVPFGTTSVLTPLNQNNVLSGIRNLEVISDSTNLLALEAAKQREEELQQNSKSVTKIKLAASQRLVRTQAFEDENFTAHFKVFALCTAGKDEGNYRFEAESLHEHLNFYLSIFNEIIEDYNTFKLKIKVFSYGKFEEVWHSAIRMISERSNVEYSLEENSDFGKTYYQKLRFMINISMPNGQSYDIVDGGFTSWTAKLLNNQKERLLTSGIGTELLLKLIG